tara:strand:- start:599 stop:715 length:117 start_codon:yes stop_codon:yes gene_type:complete
MQAHGFKEISISCEICLAIKSTFPEKTFQTFLRLIDDE